MTFKTYVIKKNGKYCQWHSYGRCELVDNPLKATLYSLKRSAEWRLKNPRGYWQGNTPAKNSDLEIFELTLDLSNEQKV